MGALSHIGDVVLEVENTSAEAGGTDQIWMNHQDEQSWKRRKVAQPRTQGDLAAFRVALHYINRLVPDDRFEREEPDTLGSFWHVDCEYGVST